MSSQFREVLQRIEEEWDILMEVFRFMSVCNGNFNEVGILKSIQPYKETTLALFASWRCLSYDDCALDLSVS